MDRHLDPLEVAQLVEGSVSELVRERSAEHLARCPHCMSLYAEFARTRLDPGIQQPAGKQWIRLGLEVGTGRTSSGTMEADSRRRRRTRTLWPALAVLAVMVGGLVSTRWRPSDPNVPEATHTVLAQLMREDSYQSLLYSAELLPEARGTRGNHGPSVDLGELGRQFELHPEDPEVAFWLISGALSTNQLRLSDSYLVDALRAFPRDPRFENLAGILAFKRNDLQNAERHLRAAVVSDRTGVAKLNLAHVLRQLDRVPEAEQLIEELRKEHSRFARAAGLER